MRCAGVLLTAALCAAAVQAQDVKLLPSAATRCLTVAPASMQPVYPPEFLRRGHSATVKVELTFTAPDRGPDVKVLVGNENNTEFVDAVRKHVEQLRVPCLEAAEAPSHVVQEFVFKPDNEPVRWTSNDPDSARRKKQLDCLKTPAGTPVYPARARRAEAEGRLYARMTFTAPDRPPEIDMRGPEDTLDIFRSAVEEWAKDYRLPCHDGTALRTSALFVYRMEGKQLYGFKDLDFVRFLGSVKGIQQQRLQFDTTQMACPFEVRVFYLQPYVHNAVAQIGAPHLERQALLNWLANAELNLSRRHHASVFGDTMTFTVPCINIDLKPKEN